MSGLQLAHLILVSLWSGIVLTEAIVETLGHVEEGLAARVHFWIDVIVEMPTVLAVLITGAILAARVWPPPPLLVAKLIAGLVAVGVNGYCFVFVILRFRARHHPSLALRYGRHVRGAVLGVPFGAAAAYLGLAYFT